MLFEQAFAALPEFLTGLPYQRFDYEGTLMSAFSMSVLQELNGRNINNPISCLRSEVVYPTAEGKRADLHLDLAAMNILTPSLRQYGIFQHNWLEAKYLKLNSKGKPTVDKLKVTLLLLKDLIRLVALPPEDVLRPSECARFLLHAYQGPSRMHVAEKKNTKGEDPGFTRSWVKSIRAPGRQQISTIHATQEVGQYDSIVGAGLRNVELEFSATTFAYEPRSTGTDVFWCYLTRIDDFKASIGADWFSRTGDVLAESQPGVMAALVDQIAAGFAD